MLHTRNYFVVDILFNIFVADYFICKMRVEH